ncbi:MAG: hypothetical protein KC931_17005 [Candidatus Omnitrophica bacterium]|nr:hypothetical protein [Candidatus Omnitrophota bacterium]MCA9431439.1 hypothetical protein [Candidatus Omnitrophota bacterium]MCA9448823.1 hypothetical protein [Candidatus Omnitrophota bacterium]
MHKNQLIPTLLLLSLGTPPLYAHRMNIFTYTEGNEIHVESYFNRGSNCMGCLVEVTDSAGQVVASGTTTEEGKWSFVPPKEEGLTVSVTASEGHRAEYTLTEADYPQSMNLSTLSEETSKVADSSVVRTLAESKTPNVTVTDQEELEAIVDRVVEKRLAPIREELRRMQVDEPGFQEIVGGIGYLFGLCGVAMYFMARSKKSN